MALQNSDPHDTRPDSDETPENPQIPEDNPSLESTAPEDTQAEAAVSSADSDDQEGASDEPAMAQQNTLSSATTTDTTTTPDSPTDDTRPSDAEDDASPEISPDETSATAYATSDDFEDDEAGAAEAYDDDEDAPDQTPPHPDDPLTAKQGTLVDGVVVSLTPNDIQVDLGDDIIGVVPPREMEYLTAEQSDTLAAGSPLTVFVLRSKNEDGQPVLSISRALEEQDWQDAERYAHDKDVYEGTIAGYNKGGLIVRFGRLRGFIPASQISQEREGRADGDNPDQRWSEMLNEDIIVKVVEVNRARNRLILSERAAARENRERQKERLIEELRIGEMHNGRVISLTDFGAFVDLGGADGLIHLTELSWKHVTHPREVLNIGDEVEVKVISIDPDRKRIGLSLKSLEDDPWQAVASQYQENQLVQGKITKLTRFGAFAMLMDGSNVEGLIHVSELAEYRVEHPRDVVAVGDVLTLRVLKIDAERRRLGLSLKRVNSSQYMGSDWESWDPDL